ncbi:nucleoside-diphosphate sugar epimerase [Paenibacillus sp. CMAA1364]
MQNKITEMVTHISHSHQQMARVIDSQRHVAVRMSQIVHSLPDANPDFQGVDGIIESSSRVNKSIISYLNSIAELEESIAESLTQVMKEMGTSDEE